MVASSVQFVNDRSHSAVSTGIEEFALNVGIVYEARPFRQLRIVVKSQRLDIDRAWPLHSFGPVPLPWCPEPRPETRVPVTLNECSVNVSEKLPVVV
jgi:hypothetical protein